MKILKMIAGLFRKKKRKFIFYNFNPVHIPMPEKRIFIRDILKTKDKSISWHESKPVKTLNGHKPCKVGECTFIKTNDFRDYKFICSKCSLLKK